jgi:hypothetical protein
MICLGTKVRYTKASVIQRNNAGEDPPADFSVLTTKEKQHTTNCGHKDEGTTKGNECETMNKSKQFMEHNNS